jgi:hypothetical protein
MTPSDFTQPGVYPNVPAAVYHAINAASSHRLGDLLKSPAHCRWNIDHPSEPSEALKMGDACHLAILSPDLLKQSYIVAGRCNGIVASGANKGMQCTSEGSKLFDGEWFCGAHHKGDSDELPAGMRKITADQLDDIARAGAAIRRHDTIRAMLDATRPEDRELTILWRDEETGLLCKARFDCLIRPGKYPGVIYDLKSTKDASPQQFPRQAKSLGYHRQLAFYLRAAAKVGIDVDKAYAVAFEVEAPYGVTVAEFSEEVITIGERENRVALRRYAECVESGVWPGYSTMPILIEHDRWMEERAGELEMEESI